MQTRHQIHQRVENKDEVFQLWGVWTLVNKMLITLKEEIEGPQKE
jgi:hypothetical protein